jgi:hypothetical protein
LNRELRILDKRERDLYEVERTLDGQERRLAEIAAATDSIPGLERETKNLERVAEELRKQLAAGQEEPEASKAMTNADEETCEASVAREKELIRERIRWEKEHMEADQAVAANQAELDRQRAKLQRKTAQVERVNAVITVLEEDVR